MSRWSEGCDCDLVHSIEEIKMTADKTTYIPVEDEPEPSNFYEFYQELTDLRAPWDNHLEEDDE